MGKRDWTEGWYKTYQRFQNGEIGAQEAFPIIMTALIALDDILISQKQTQNEIRNALSIVVAAFPDERASIPELGTAIITSASTPTPSYDYRGIDLIINDLKAAGQGEIASRLEFYRRVGESRPGTLRIIRAGENSKTRPQKTGKPGNTNLDY